MRRYMQMLSDVFRSIPKRTAVTDGKESITYGEVDIESGKVYKYLKDHGVGREDMVYIIIPKSIHFMSCVIGVWKAGAAFVINAPDYPPERIEYIRKDMNAKLVLDMNLFGDIVRNGEYLPGYEETDLHDAAYAVYTSGSTGRPKGVLHEFGNVDQAASYADVSSGYPETRHGLVPPLSFVAFEIFFITASVTGKTFYTVSDVLLRNQPELTRFIEDNRLDEIYLPPSYIRIYRKPSPFLKRILTGSEPANGLYYPGGVPEIQNVYSMSEAGFHVLTGVLDRSFEVAPVGRPGIEGIRYALIDDDGREVKGAGQGELCFENEYVRGYINLPEKTAEVFRDGMYHTGDICRRDENGIYYVAGRKDDMFKINGNRIEPAEIEARICELTGLGKVIAKGFDEDGRQFICLYFQEEEARKRKVLADGTLSIDRKKLANLLPAYMLPSYYVPLKQFPVNQNGKIARKELKSPDVRDYMGEVIPPVNETEKYFCDAFAEVLGISDIGRNSDFFLAGGDSIKAIQLVQACRKYPVSVSELYERKTPERLALIAEEPGERENPAHSEMMKEGCRDINQSGMPFFGAFMNNITADTYIRLRENADIPALNESLRAVLRSYPFYHQHLEAENGKLFYVRDADDPKVWRPDEKVEREDRFRVIADGKNITVRVPHAFTDGFGIQLFTRALISAYTGLLKGNDAGICGEETYYAPHYYEMFSEDFSAYGREIPAVYKAFRGTYRLPEPEEEGNPFRYTVRIRGGALPALSPKMAEALSCVGDDSTVTVANMTAEAIAAVRPGAEKIGCRTPVNLRKILHHEESLKNMSLCQAVFVPGKDAYEELLSSIKPETLKWQLARYGEILDGKRPDPESMELIDAIRHPTFLLTNVKGKGAAYPDVIESVDSEVTTDIPLLVVVGNEGEDVTISFIQKFKSRIYFDKFCELFTG